MDYWSDDDISTAELHYSNTSALQYSCAILILSFWIKHFERLNYGHFTK